jgi:hypothetical protein
VQLPRPYLRAACEYEFAGKIADSRDAPVTKTVCVFITDFSEAALFALTYRESDGLSSA